MTKISHRDHKEHRENKYSMLEKMHVIPAPAFAGAGSGGNPVLNRLGSDLKEKQVSPHDYREEVRPGTGREAGLGHVGGRVTQEQLPREHRGHREK
jgi:hypothetical protein